MITRRPAAVLILGLAAVLVACSDPAPVRPSTAPSAPLVSISPSTVTPTPTVTPAAFRMPLALIVHPTRTVRDVPLSAARRALTGSIRDWSELLQPGGTVRVLSVTASRPAGQVISAVRDSDEVLGIVPADAVDATVRVLRVGGIHPLREPARYPLTVTSTAPAPVITTVSAVGDIMLGRRVGDRMAARDDWTEPFAHTARRLRGADITVGNFESTLSKAGDPTQGADSFATDPRALAGLKDAGFDLVSLANNHLGDYGQRAMRQTFDRFEGTGIATVGAGRNDSEARLPVIIVRNDFKIGFLAVDSVGETPAATKTAAGTNRLDMPPRTGPPDEQALQRISGDIADLAVNTDAVIVLTHWGMKDTRRPEANQRTAAQAFAAAGADLIIGGHPHWVQGWQRFGTTPVVYSVGNFVFDRDVATKTREGVFLETVFWNGSLKAVDPVPYVIGDDFAPRVVTGSRAERILDDVWSTSRGPYAKP